MLTLALSGNRGACLIAAAVYALWCPGIGNATMLAKENLSTPLLLGIALCAIRIARGERPAGTALVAGLLWGAALVTGRSALLLCFGVAAALLMLWRPRGRFPPAFSAGLCFLVVPPRTPGPSLLATHPEGGRRAVER